MSLPRRVSSALFLRALLIQGSWNYRTLVGTGMGFALLPVLRYLHGSDEAALEAALERHAGAFNAHPYLAALALGGLARLEHEGAPAETVRRFRAAIGGPLGGLGDRVVWATWLPFASVVGLAVASSGLGPIWGAAVFVALYNVGHLALRVWCLSTGLREGTGVAAALARADLARRAGRLETGLLVGAGVAVGLLANDPAGLAGAPWGWGAAAGMAFAVGAVFGGRAWRPAALVVVVATGAIMGWEWIT